MSEKDLGFAASQPKQGVVNTEKHSLLLVEDDLELQQVISSHLTSAGFEVLCCANGVEAAEKYHEMGPDLVILDLMLPRVNGMEFLTLIQDFEKRQKKERLSVLVITGSADSQMIKEVKKKKGVEVLSKPFALEELEKRIKLQLGYELRGDSLDFKRVQAALPKLAGPNPNLFKTLPTTISPTLWTPYPHLEDKKEYCFLVPVGVTPRELRSFTSQGMQKQLRVFLKTANSWKEVWPAEDMEEAA